VVIASDAVIAKLDTAVVNAAEIFVVSGGVAIVRAVLGMEGGCMAGPLEWATVWLQDTSCASLSSILQMLACPKFISQLLSNGVIACVADVCKVLLRGLEVCQVKRVVKSNAKQSRRPSKVVDTNALAGRAPNIPECDVSISDESKAKETTSSLEKVKAEGNFPIELEAIPSCLALMCCFITYSLTPTNAPDEHPDIKYDEVLLKSMFFSSWMKDVVKA